MKSFEYCVPTRVVFGTDSLEKLPAQLEKCGALRVLVVYGGQSAKKSGLLDKVLAILSGAGSSHQELGGVQPNPHLGLAREGVKKAIAMDAQLILAIGGGSVIDTAKAIAPGKANPEIDIWAVSYTHLDVYKRQAGIIIPETGPFVNTRGQIRQASSEFYKKCKILLDNDGLA